MEDKKKVNKKSSNTLKSIAIFTGIAAQMGVTIFLGAYFGKWLDIKYPADKKWFTMLFTLIGVGISLYVVLKQLNKFNNAQDK
ncbi:MAG: AtpZ/AtpI family protein [Vicingaceae bacterium]|nr:AtpZ/AtpI family protein [Vicingaceae bacterium]